MSLKDKRMVVKSIKERCKSRFNVSVVECGETDKWQKCVMCFAVAAAAQSAADQIKQDIIEFLSSDGRIEVINTDSF
jgi:uncharacterized protein